MGDFPSEPGMVFPVYDVLAAIAPPRSWQRCTAVTADEARVEALALANDGTVRVLLANVTGSEQRVVVEGLGGGSATVERIDAETVARSLDRPRVADDGTPTVAGQLTMHLAPYEVAVITAEPPSS